VKRFLPIVMLSAALAVLAAGCGGKSAEEKYADSVCTDIGSWKNTVQKSADEVRTQVQSPAAGTLAVIDSEIQKAVDATKSLASDLRGLEPPDSDEGRQARQELNTFAAQAETTVTKAKQTASSVPENADARQIASALAPLLPSVRSLASQASSTVQAVEQRGEKIKEGFEKADSCEQFRA
jgi:methyl-accepting chemotaxis protein